MHVFFSTVIRGAPAQKGGELLSLDWKTKRIIARVPIVSTNPPVIDPNSRGGGRGGRGIVVLRDELIVASYHTLHCFDHDLRPKRTITNFNFAGLHELKLVEDGIWTTSTALGLAQKVDFNGNPIAEWWAHDDPLVQQEFAPAAFSVDKIRDNRLLYLENFSKLHLNYIEVHEGEVYVCFNHHGTVLRLFPTEIVARNPTLKGCHNGIITAGGEILLCDSHSHTLVILDLKTGRVRRLLNLAEFPEVANMRKFRTLRDIPAWQRLKNLALRNPMAHPLFTRGLCLLDDSRVLVGLSPASILEVDYQKNRLLDMFTLSTNANECVHGLEALPSVDCPFERSTGRAFGAAFAQKY